MSVGAGYALLQVGKVTTPTIPNQTFKISPEGDSITIGLGGVPAWPFVALASMPGANASIPGTNSPSSTPFTGGGSAVMNDIATSGISVLTIVQNYSTRAGASFDAAKNINILSLMIGTNTSGATDTTAAQKYGLIRSYLRLAEATGYQRKIIGTIPARDDDGGVNWTNFIVPLNSLIRTYFNSDLRCDGLADFGNDPRFGSPAAADNLTYYTSDKLHPNIVGEAAMGSIAFPALLAALQGPGAQTVTTTFSPFDTQNLQVVLSNGNRTVTTPVGPVGQAVMGFPAKKSGKWYWQIANGPNNDVGIVNETYTFGGSYLDNTVNSLVAINNGNIFYNATIVATVAAMAAGDVTEVCMDNTAQLIWFGPNHAGVRAPWNGNGSANPATGVGGISISGLGTGYIHPAIGIYQPGDSSTCNFAASQFQNGGTPPAGFSTFG